MGSNWGTVSRARPHHVHPFSSDGRVRQRQAAAPEEDVQQAAVGVQVWRRSKSGETIIQREVLRSGENRLQGTGGDDWWLPDKDQLQWRSEAGQTRLQGQGL